MLYEVITIPPMAENLDSTTFSLVITSYSIHYTKLYDNTGYFLTDLSAGYKITSNLPLSLAVKYDEAGNFQVVRMRPTGDEQWPERNHSAS